MYPPRISSDRPKSLTLSIVSSAIFYSGRVKAWKIFRRNIANVNRLSRRQLHTVLHFLRIYSTLYCGFHPDIWWSPYYSFYIIESASAKRIKLNKVAERLTHDRIYQRSIVNGLTHLLRSNVPSSLYLLRISSKFEIDCLNVSRSMTKQVTPSSESQMILAVRRSSLFTT